MSRPQAAQPQATSSGAVAYYRHSVNRRAMVLVLLAAAGCIAMVLDIAVGSGTLTPANVVQGLFSPASVDSTIRAILWEVRAPITCAAALAGIQLALAGSLIQTALNNPLAEPLTIGISSAAGFGAALALIFGISFASLVPWLPAELFVAINAFLFALMTVLLIAGLAGRASFGVETITLVGIAVHFTFSAMLAFAQYVADPNQLQSLVFWLLGSLLRATWLKIAINAMIVAAVLPLLLMQARAMTALRGFGDQAVVLGIRVERLRVMMMIAAALLAGSATATVGIVGFVGLVAPHMARLIVGEDQRFSLGVTAACGMLMLTLASLASKLILPGVILPIGMVTSILGIPFFLALVLRGQRRI